MRQNCPHPPTSYHSSPLTKLCGFCFLDGKQALEIEGLHQHVGNLESERSQVQIELEKLRDLIAVKAPDSVQGDTKYGDRDSYLPDSGPLYDMVKKMQAIVRAR